MATSSDSLPSGRPAGRPRWSACWQGGRVVFPILLAIGIVSLSGTENPAAPGGIPFFDKLAHFCVFGLLATLIIRLVPEGARLPWSATGVVLLVSLFGLSDEFHQSFTPGRMVEFADWVADTLGALVAVWVYCRWGAYRRLLEYRAGRNRN